MATTDKNTIYSWFQTDDFPTEDQFRATWDSFWHKSESIPMSQIQGLSQAFVNTATTSQVNAKANIDASNISAEDVDNWKAKILPENIALVDTGENPEVYSKEQTNAATANKLDKGTYTGNSAQDLKDEIDNLKYSKLNTPGTLGHGSIGFWYNLYGNINNFMSSEIYQDGVNNIGITKTNPTEKLDVNGNIKANAYKFTLPSVLTPTPNTLVPKTDGSGLMWYDNNSVGGELFTGTPFVYNVPSTITVNHINAPASPDVPSYVQEIQDRLTQLNQPWVTMLKFQNWNVVTANNVTNSNIGVINNNLIKTFISAFDSETSIPAQSSIISISTNKVLPADKDWVVMFTTNLGHDGEYYSNGGVKFVMKRHIGLFSGDTSGFVPPEVYIFDAGAVWSWNNHIKLQSGKICSGSNETSTNNTINTNDESANVQVTMLKAGNHILVQIYYAGYAISDIYSSTILSGDAGFSVLCKKPSSGGNGYVGEVSNVRYYIFP